MGLTEAGCWAVKAQSAGANVERALCGVNMQLSRCCQASLEGLRQRARRDKYITRFSICSKHLALTISHAI